MKKYFGIAFILFSGHSHLFSQTEKLTLKVLDWYKTARFETVDANSDGKLSKSELENYKSEFIFYFEKDNFNLADIDKDGCLNKEELDKRWDGEDNLRILLENQKTRSIIQDYPKLPIADKQYLLENPELVVILMGNATWMQNNAFLADEIMGSTHFLKNNPSVYQAMRRNFYWLAFHPFLAQKLYNSPLAEKFTPELKKWAESHNTFIKKTPELKKSATFNEEMKKEKEKDAAK